MTDDGMATIGVWSGVIISRPLVFVQSSNVASVFSRNTRVQVSTPLSRKEAGRISLCCSTRIVA